MEQQSENPLKSTYKPETTRNERIFNIATAVIELHNFGYRRIRITSLRRAIRDKLSLPVLEGELRHGDMRATGDALGGHGLQIKPVRERGEKIINVTQQVLDSCNIFLKTYDNRINKIF